MHRGQLGPTSSGWVQQDSKQTNDENISLQEQINVNRATMVRGMHTESSSRKRQTHNTLLINDGGINVEADSIGIGQAFHGADDVGSLERRGTVAKVSKNLLAGGRGR